jgi:hypothetical protein
VPGGAENQYRQYQVEHQVLNVAGANARIQFQPGQAEAGNNTGKQAGKGGFQSQQTMQQQSRQHGDRQE